jgi:FkbM family methyltransferase
MDFIKGTIRSAFRACGYEVARRDTSVGFHKDADIYRLLSATPNPVIFDVGANIGQSVEEFKKLFPSSVIHSFEPSPGAFAKLQETSRRFSGVHLNNVALGASPATAQLQENTSSDMSSFLPLDKDAWGRIEKQTTVQVATLDDYCAGHDIPRVDLLKIDTQGYDLEVVKGARRLMAEGRINLVLIEIGFAKFYKGAPQLDEIYRFFIQNRFRLVSFYALKYIEGFVSECNGLFAPLPAGSAAQEKLP